MITVCFLLIKLLYYFLLIIFLDCLGQKLDNEADAISWFALFSPVYLLCIFVITWGVLHCCSLKNTNIKKVTKVFLYVSLLFIVGKLAIVYILNSVLGSKFNIHPNEIRKHSSY